MEDEKQQENGAGQNVQATAQTPQAQTIAPEDVSKLQALADWRKAELAKEHSTLRLNENKYKEDIELRNNYLALGKAEIARLTEISKGNVDPAKKAEAVAYDKVLKTRDIETAVKASPVKDPKEQERLIAVLERRVKDPKDIAQELNDLLPAVITPVPAPPGGGTIAPNFVSNEEQIKRAKEKKER